MTPAASDFSGLPDERPGLVDGPDDGDKLEDHGRRLAIVGLNLMAVFSLVLGWALAFAGGLVVAKPLVFLGFATMGFGGLLYGMRRIVFRTRAR